MNILFLPFRALFAVVDFACDVADGLIRGMEDDGKRPLDAALEEPGQMTLDL